MKIFTPNKAVTASILALALTLSGCSSVTPKVGKEDKVPVYRVAFSQLPQPPVYNRVKKVYLPSVLPEVSSQSEDEKSVSLPQVYDLNLKDVTVEKAAVALAAVGGYDHYTASTVAERPLTLKAVGSLDELAVAVGNASNTHVVVDHINRQVRIVAKTGE